MVIVGNGGRASAGRERQACLSRLSCVDGRSTQAFVYSATISPDRKLLQVVIGCNSLIGSLATPSLVSNLNVPQLHFFIPASTCHNLTFLFLLGSFSDTFLGLKFQCATTSLFHSCFHVPQPHFSIPASTSHNLTFPFLLPPATGLLFGDNTMLLAMMTMKILFGHPKLILRNSMRRSSAHPSISLYTPIIQAVPCSLLGLVRV